MRVDFHADDLRPLVRAVVAEVMAELERAEVQVPADKLAYSEAEAASLLSLLPHQLRDERRRGRIAASQVVGGRVRYTAEALREYLADRQVSPD